jgi:hypothetical protein
VLKRGNATNPGEEVPRRFLDIISGDKRETFHEGSGRLEMAKLIASRDNPLTARVMVNRVWQHHFGRGIVTTPSDFGTRSTPPSHPELLDDLAARLRDEGWSLKALHRLIVLSRTYRQSSFDRPGCRKVDPENRLLWHYPRRRLDLESMRDAMLFVAGRLDGRMGGRSVDVAGDPANRRRTVYGLVDRQSLPTFFRAFDFASPDQSAERRPRTTVPQQALYSMNAPFVIEQARALAARSEVAGASTTEGRIAAIYRAALGRMPTAVERRVATLFLAPSDRRTEPPPTGRRADSSVGGGSGPRPDPARASGTLSRWEQFAQVLLMTNEFLFVD